MIQRKLGRNLHHFQTCNITYNCFLNLLDLEQRSNKITLITQEIIEDEDEVKIKARNFMLSI